jgi:hypothetical protein
MLRLIYSHSNLSHVTFTRAIELYPSHLARESSELSSVLGSLRKITGQQRRLLGENVGRLRVVDRSLLSW